MTIFKTATVHFALFIALTITFPAISGETVASLVSVAENARLQGKYEEAIRLYARVAEDPAAGPAAQEADVQIESCIVSLGSLPDGRTRLKKLAEPPLPPRIRAKAILQLAVKYYWENRTCSSALPLYEQVERDYPNTDEAVIATIEKSMKCLVPIGRDDEAITNLRHIVAMSPRQKHRPYALYELGLLYRWREERHKSRQAFEKLIADYPDGLEYPGPGQRRLVRDARLNLKDLDSYRLGPVLDWSVSRLSRWLGLDRSPTHPLREGGEFAIEGAVVLATRLLGLGLCVAAASLLGIGGGSIRTGRCVLFRDASLKRAVVLVSIVAAIGLIDYLLAAWTSCLDVSVKDRLKLDGWLTLGYRSLTIGVMLYGSLRKESVRRVFRMRRDSFAPVLLLVLAGVVAYFVASNLLAGLMSWSRGAPIRGLPTYNALRDSAGPIWWGIIAIGLSIGTAVGEESLYRGVVFEAFESRSNWWVGGILSSLLFGMMHVRHIWVVINFSIFGMTGILLRKRFGSLLPSVLCHVAVSLPSILLGQV